MVPDFSGYVTKSGIKCSDGRTIVAHAFKSSDKQQVPLVWQHQHNEPENVLGHVMLTARDDGTWGDGFFNSTPAGQQAKALVIHKDITALSIYANQLVEHAKNVVHGVIREVSLVLSGANPGAYIENVNVAHADGNIQLVEDEAIIYSGQPLVLAHAVSGLSQTVAPPRMVMPSKGAMPMAPAAPAAPAAGKTVQEVFDSLDPEQRELLFAFVGATAQQSAVQSSDNPVDKDGGAVTRNVFDQTGDNDKNGPVGATLSHSDIQSIFESAKKGGSLKGAVEEYALSHGIDNISTLFPYDQAVTTSPDFISRRMEWVTNVLGGVHKTPFSRIRSWTADITLDEARAKGYIKASLKREEFFRISRRITTPQTIYKKQKLDRDDILDITDFDVVNWLQTEMRILLDEEVARAILIGDGRDVADQDKINVANIRPIYGDDAMYTTPVNVATGTIGTGGVTADIIVDAVVNAMRFYFGSGDPTFYTTLPWLAKLLLTKDTLGRRLYATKAELASAMGVSSVVPVQVMETVPGLIGIIANLTDYTVGADKGGQVSMFDFFDIDYNQFKYLMETRISGANVKYKSAIALQSFTGVGGLLPDPSPVTFNNSTGVATVPTFAGLHLTYHTVDQVTGAVSGALTVGVQTAIAPGAYVTYRAVPDATYEFAMDVWDWNFHRDI